ncbi:hypothetical protein [Candidatus Tisiphia endosymbiont of Hybos culiciformis]|uniref:hypothetical protein n=1 Tax=Candidatus Tisiphia endosymbiont of Hybos culiciformis TaxID=3139331 RepID=UPI003CCB6959
MTRESMGMALKLWCHPCERSYLDSRLRGNDKREYGNGIKTMMSSLRTQGTRFPPTRE